MKTKIPGLTLSSITRFGIYLFMTLIASQLTAQMQVYPGSFEQVSAESIFNDVFLGNGVEIIDVDYEGLDASVGLFENSESQIGLNRGIVLSTGFVSQIPRTSSLTASGQTSGENFSNPDLEELAGINVKDIAQFKIKFRPTSDTLRFRYVFASEEYAPEYVCSIRNDAFGFFIKKNSEADDQYRNIALVPDPSNEGEFLPLPVTINTVNSGILPPGRDSTDCVSLEYNQFYNQLNPTDIPVFYGYLDIFVAQAIVEPCEIYDLVITIGDGADGEADSAVFLEEKSFNTGSLEINVNNPGVNGGISEGCEPGEIEISLPEAVSSDLQVEVIPINNNSLPDLAIPDVDFRIEETDIFIPAGQHSTKITLSPISDNEDESTEFIYLRIRRDICNVDTLVVPIFDNSLNFIELPDTVFTCYENPVRIEALLGSEINLIEPSIFSSSTPVFINNPDTVARSAIQVSGLPQEFLTPRMISSVCIDTLFHTRLNDLDIYLKAPSGQYLELTTDNGARVNNEAQIDSFINTCFVISAPNAINFGNTLESNLIPGNPNYTGAYEPEGSWASWLSPNVSLANGTYELLIIDDQGEYSGELVSWTITFNSIYDIDFSWTPTNGLNCLDCPSVNTVLQKSQYYYLSLTDSYMCSNKDSVWVEVIPEPEKLEVNCEAVSPTSVRISWDQNPDATEYEFRVQEKFPWIKTNRTGLDNPLLLFGFKFDFVSETEVIIEGLLPEEELDVIVRGNALNPSFANACLGVQDTIICVSAPCDDVLPIIDDINIVQPDCAMQAGVNVTITATDPNTPLTYRVYTDNFTFENNTGVFLSLPQGDIPIRVINAAGCTVLDTIKINEPPPIIITPEVTNITCSGENDGMIIVQAEGEDPPFQFAWDNVISDSDTIRNLSPNTYTVTVTDNKGCESFLPIPIIDPDPINYSYIQLDTIDCLGNRPGVASLEISGGLPPYEVVWNNTITSDTIFDQAVGQSYYRITDSYGCVISDSALVIQRTGFDITSESSELNCFTDSIATATVFPSNGLAPYEYSWENQQETQTANNLHAGANYVTITDQDGCVEIDSIIVPSPPEIIVLPTIEATSCFGGADGSIDISIQGGVGSQYMVNWYDNSSGSKVTDLPAGNYCVTVSDVNLCEAIKCFEVPDATVISINEDVQNISCENECDGAISLNPFGGSGNFIFRWESPENSFASREENLTDLCIGSYFVTISEASNAACNQVFEIVVELDNKINIVLDPIREVSCFGGNNGQLEAVIGGGTEPYNIVWSSNVTNFDTTIAQDLVAGNYSVTVTDNNGCSSESQIILTEPDSIQASFTNEDVVCFGATTGSSMVEISGGTAPYLYEWSNQETTDTINNLSAGNYTLSVVDKNGCDFTDETIINQPLRDIKVDFEFTEISCFGGSDGVVRIEVQNAVDPVQYSLDDINFKFDSTFINLTSGDYTAYIIDANGCSKNLDFFLPEGEDLIVDLGPDTTVQFSQNITLSVLVENNQGDIFYDWNSSLLGSFSCSDCPNPVVQNVESSFTVSVTVEDEFGCMGRDFINVSVIEDRSIQVPTAFTPDGDSVNDMLHVFGGNDIQILKFQVYSKWGELVYERRSFDSNDLTIGWDGTFKGEPALQGSYVWTAEYILQSGRVEFNSGQTTLIR